MILRSKFLTANIKIKGLERVYAVSGQKGHAYERSEE